MALSISPSPFGTLSVVVKDTPGTVIVSTVATSPSVLSMALGVPGPTGATGATGAAGQNGTNGSNGSNGVGVPTGGTTGQALVKTSGTDYATNWASMLPLAGGTMSNDATQTFITTDGTRLIVKPTEINSKTFSTYNYSDPGNPFSPYQQIGTFSAKKVQSNWNDDNWEVGFKLDEYEVSGGLVYSDGYDPDYRWSFGSNGLRFSNGTTQVSAFPPSGGTSSDYIDGTGGIQTFPTIPSLTGYATESYVTSQGYITSSSLTPYLTTSSAASTYQTQSGMSSYLTTSSAASTYFAKPTGDASQYLNGAGTPVTFPTVGTAGKMVVLASNQTGSTIAKGSVVYISGSQGNDPKVSLARADVEATSAYTIGVAESSINNNSTGNIIVLGLLEGFNTSAFTDGDAVYLSSTTAGGITGTKQFSPNHYVKVGTIVRAHPTQGTIFIKVENGYQLDELSDCYVTTPTNNNVLSFESSTGLWKDKSITTLLGYTPSNDTLGNLSSASTARTNLGLTAAATASFSTEAQSVAGISTTVVSNPATVQALALHPEWFVLNAGNATSVVSGTGLAVAQEFGFQLATGTTSGSYAIRKFSPSTQVGISRGRDAGIWDYSKQIVISGTGLYSNAQTNTNTRVSLGKVTGDNNGDLARAGIGFKRVGTGALQLMVHNGTTLTVSTNGTFTPTANQTFDWKIIADGAGNATLYVNETSVATTTGCPTGQSTNTANFIQYEIDCSATLGSQTIMYIGNPKILQGR